MQNVNREKLTVTIITRNEENNISDCLESVKWADEIIVVDSESDDGTVNICKRYTDKVYSNPWPGHKEQKNFAISKASNLWILSIDADERVSAGLKEFILKELKGPGLDGYRFPRQNFFLGKWMKHGGWYPDYVLRLFRKDRGHFTGINPHDYVSVETGKVMTVPVSLAHYTYHSMFDYVSRQNSYSCISAMEEFKKGRCGINPLFMMPLRVLLKFLETYVLKMGFLDGPHGLVAAMGAAYATYLKQTKIWELKQGMDNRLGKPEA